MRRHKSTPSSHVRVTVTCHVSLVKMGLAIAVHRHSLVAAVTTWRPHKTKKKCGGSGATKRVHILSILYDV